MTSAPEHLLDPESEFLPDQENDRIAQFTFDLRPRLITVAATERLTPRMARICFTGEDLGDFPTVAPEDHVKLFFDKLEDGTVSMPAVVGGRWTGRDYTYRDYTVRGYDRAARRLIIDFVLHDHGVAGRWAGGARVGDQLGMLGPRGAFLVKDIADWYLLAADETALPALSRWLESLRPGVLVTALVEVQDAADEIGLITDAALTLHWLHRGSAAPGTTTLLAEAVRAQPLPPGLGFVWVAGESVSIKPVRRYLRRDLGLDRDSWDVDGYWRRGAVNHDHHDEPDEPDEPGEPGEPDA